MYARAWPGVKAMIHDVSYLTTIDGLDSYWNHDELAKDIPARFACSVVCSLIPPPSPTDVCWRADLRLQRW